MAGRSDDSAIKALFPPRKGEPPHIKKSKSPSSKNDLPPDESIASKSPPKNTPPPVQNRKTPSPHKNAPQPDQNKPNSSSLKNVSTPPPKKMTKKKKTKIFGKPHLKSRLTSWTYSRGQRPYPAKCRSMALCSIWRKWDLTKRKERCLSLSWTNDPERLLSPPKTWYYVCYPAWA